MKLVYDSTKIYDIWVDDLYWDSCCGDQVLQVQADIISQCGDVKIYVMGRLANV